VAVDYTVNSQNFKDLWKINLISNKTKEISTARVGKDLSTFLATNIDLALMTLNNII
jgi:hypothetical protein